MAPIDRVSGDGLQGELMDREQEERIKVTIWNGLCGCGCPELAVRLMRDVLSCFERRDESADKHIAKLEALLGPEDGGVFWWYLYFLDHLGLTEHRTGISFAWLTELGKQVLSWITDYGTDPNKWPTWYEEKYGNARQTTEAHDEQTASVRQ